MSTDCLQEAKGEGGDGRGGRGEVGRTAGTIVSSSLPKEDAESQAKHVLLLILKSVRGRTAAMNKVKNAPGELA